MSAPLTWIPALQKLLCPLYPAWQLCCAPPSVLQSLLHQDSQSRVSLALLKLPLGNITPYTKPEMPEAPTHARRRTHARTQKKTGKHEPTQATHCILNVGVTWLLFSLLRQQDKWWLSDRRFTLQEPIAVRCGDGRVGSTLFFFPAD